MKSFKQEPAIGLWNVAAREKLEPVLYRPTGDARSLERRAIERWENEGGEIPKCQPHQDVSDRSAPTNRFTFGGGYLSDPGMILKDDRHSTGSEKWKEPGRIKHRKKFRRQESRR